MRSFWGEGAPRAAGSQNRWTALIRRCAEGGSPINPAGFFPVAPITRFDPTVYSRERRYDSRGASHGASAPCVGRPQNHGQPQHKPHHDPLGDLTDRLDILPMTVEILVPALIESADLDRSVCGYSNPMQ